jgi:hypothetical protein
MACAPCQVGSPSGWRVSISSTSFSIGKPLPQRVRAELRLAGDADAQGKIEG